MAAQAAGMRSVFVTCCATDVTENAALATAAVSHYLDLPASFWSQPASGVEALRIRVGK
jgi:hypothetical protein